MKAWFFLYLKRYISSVSFVVTVLAVLFAVFLLSGVGKEDISGMDVGLVMSEDNVVTGAQQSLVQKKDGIVRYILYEDETELKNALNHGYICFLFSVFFVTLRASIKINVRKETIF